MVAGLKRSKRGSRSDGVAPGFRAPPPLLHPDCAVRLPRICHARFAGLTPRRPHADGSFSKAQNESVHKARRLRLAPSDARRAPGWRPAPSPRDVGRTPPNALTAFPTRPCLSQLRQGTFSEDAGHLPIRTPGRLAPDSPSLCGVHVRPLRPLPPLRTQHRGEPALPPAHPSVLPFLPIACLFRRNRTSPSPNAVFPATAQGTDVVTSPAAPGTCCLLSARGRDDPSRNRQLQTATCLTSRFCSS